MSLEAATKKSIKELEGLNSKAKSLQHFKVNQVLEINATLHDILDLSEGQKIWQLIKFKIWWIPWVIVKILNPILHSNGTKL